MYIYMHIHIQMHVNVHTRTYVHTHTYTHVYAYIYIHIHVYMSTYIHIQIHLYIYIYVYMYLSIWVCFYIQELLHEPKELPIAKRQSPREQKTSTTLCHTDGRLRAAAEASVTEQERRSQSSWPGPGSEAAQLMSQGYYKQK